MIKKILGIVLGITLIGTLAFGQELISKYNDKFLGMINKINPRLIPENNSPSMSNYNCDESGSITERDTFEQYNTSSGALGSNYITGLFKYYKSANAKYFVSCAGSKIASGSAGTLSDITNAGISIVSGKQWESETFQDYLFLANPSVLLQYWDGTAATTTTVTNAAGITNCRHIKLHKNRIFLANSDTYPNRLYYSRLGTSTVIIATAADGLSLANDAGYIDVASNDGDEITALEVFGDYLYIIKKNSIYVLLGSSPKDFTVRKTPSEVGCLATKTIAKFSGGIIFLGKKAVYFFNGSNSVSLSDNIEPTITAISKTLIYNATACYDAQNKYWLSYTSTNGTENDSILIYDLQLKEWYQYDGLYFNDFEVAMGGNDRGEVYAGSSLNNGIIWKTQEESTTENITHSSKTQLLTGTTFNTVIGNFETSPTVTTQYCGWLFTKLLMHADALKEETGGVVTAQGNASIKTDQKVIGTGSIYVDGDADWVELVDTGDTDFAGADLGAGEFTIEFWIRFFELANDGLIGQWDDTGSKGWRIAYSTAAGTIDFIYSTTGVNEVTKTFEWTPVINTWYRVAFTRTGNTLRFFKDGKPSATTYDLAGVTIFNSTDHLTIGARSSGAGADSYFKGWFDEIRISNKSLYGDVYNTDSSVAFVKDLHNNFGTLTSKNINIGIYGEGSLGNIIWSESLPSGTDVAFQTRTGRTDDTVYFNGWEQWLPVAPNKYLQTDNVVTVWIPSDDNYTRAVAGGYQAASPDRNILFYEDEDEVSPNCVQVTMSSVNSAKDYVETTIPARNISSNYVTFWLRPTQYVTADTILRFGMGEASGDELYTTCSTVTHSSVASSNANWQKVYWYIGGIPAAERDAIKYLRFTVVSGNTGTFYFDKIMMNNYITDSDTAMSSTPNDYISYRAILASSVQTESSTLLYQNGTVVTLNYTPAGSGTTESSLDSSYYTKYIDFDLPQINKQFSSLALSVYSPTKLGTLYADYSVEKPSGIYQTGILTFPITRTGNTIRIYKNFSSNIYGKSIQFNFRNSDLNTKVTIRDMELRAVKEKPQDN